MLNDIRESEGNRREWIVEVLKDIDGMHTGYLHKGELVRCKECKYWIGETEHYEDREYKACWQLCGQYMDSEFWCKYGEREDE